MEGLEVEEVVEIHLLWQVGEVGMVGMGIGEVIPEEEEEEEEGMGWYLIKTR